MGSAPSCGRFRKKEHCFRAKTKTAQNNGIGCILGRISGLRPPAVFEHDKYYIGPDGICQAKPARIGYNF